MSYIKGRSAVVGRLSFTVKHCWIIALGNSVRYPDTCTLMTTKHGVCSLVPGRCQMTSITELYFQDAGWT